MKWLEQSWLSNHLAEILIAIIIAGLVGMAGMAVKYLASVPDRELAIDAALEERLEASHVRPSGLQAYVKLVDEELADQQSRLGILWKSSILKFPPRFSASYLAQKAIMMRTHALMNLAKLNSYSPETTGISPKGHDAIEGAFTAEAQIWESVLKLARSAEQHGHRSKQEQTAYFELINKLPDVVYAQALAASRLKDATRDLSYRIGDLDTAKNQASLQLQLVRLQAKIWALVLALVALVVLFLLVWRWQPGKPPAEKPRIVTP